MEIEDKRSQTYMQFVMFQETFEELKILKYEYKLTSEELNDLKQKHQQTTSNLYDTTCQLESL